MAERMIGSSGSTSSSSGVIVGSEIKAVAGDIGTGDFIGVLEAEARDKCAGLIR